MRWTKLGLVPRPPGLPWALTHCMTPTPVLREREGVVRVYFSSLDAEGIGRPGYVDLDAGNPARVVGFSPTPLMDIGRPGTFDENGVLPTSVIRLPDGRWRMYYVGFELGTRVRYRLLSGAAESDETGQQFVRVQETPVLERSPEELLFRGGPFVRAGGDGYEMWYVAGSHFEDVGGKPMPVYSLRYLTSCDGLRWGPAGQTALELSHVDEHGFGRPWVVELGGRERLFYSVRRRSLRAYRIGMATRLDSGAWQREDEMAGLEPGPAGFDDTAIMYAAPIRVGAHVYCFYNGNAFGVDGIGLARLEECSP